MSSRLAINPHGRLIAVGTCPELNGLRWVVLDWLELFEPKGRAPTPRERATTRAPYESNSAKRARRERVEVPDELLDEEEAIRQAMIEQRREPVHLVSAAA